MIKLAEEAVDTTEPTVDIQPQTIKAIAYTQGINGGKGEWDGMLEFAENIAPIVVIPTTMQLFNEELTTLTQDPTKSDFAEILANIEIPVVKFVGFSEKITTNEIITDYTFSTEKSSLYEYDKNYVTADSAYKLKTEYKYTSTEQSIDSGRMEVVQLDFTQFENVEGVTITNG